MKRRVVVCAVFALLVFAAVASAAFLPMHHAKSAAAKNAKTACQRGAHCHDWGVLKCRRISRSKVDCKVFNENRDGGKYTCTTWVRVRKTHHHVRARPRQPRFCVNGWRY